MRALLASILVLLAGCGKPRTAVEGLPKRVVSLAPSLTECIYAVGAGDRLVGVTAFCNYPPEAESLPRIGGYSDTNYEQIYKLQPDLVILLPEHTDARDRLDALGIAHVTVDTFTIQDILETLETLGDIFGVQASAKAEVHRLQSRIDALHAAVRNAPERSVLVSIGRSSTGELAYVYAAGRHTLYDDMLEKSGARNVYDGPVEYAPISRESIMRMNPEVIIDLIPDLQTSGTRTPEEARRDWDVLPDVAAVKNRQVHVLGDPYVCIPGPRFILTLENIARAIHPESFGERP